MCLITWRVMRVRPLDSWHRVTRRAMSARPCPKAGVRQDRILFVTLIAASQGIHKLCMRYPQLKIITSEVGRCRLTVSNPVLKAPMVER